MKLVIKKIELEKLKTYHFLRILGSVLIILLTIGIFLFWQETIGAEALILLILGLMAMVLVSILGIRVAQRDGFMDGFLDGRDGVKKIKK